MFEKLELYFSCSKLPDRDFASKSDPSIVLSISSKEQPKPVLAGKTETISNNLNPVFRKAIDVDYYFETVQTLHIECVDDDGSGKSDILGTASCTLAQILMNRASEGLTLPLASQHSKDTKVTIRYQKVPQSRANYHFKVRCTKVKDKCFFCGSTNPFLRVFRPSPDYEAIPDPKTIPQNGWVQIYESEFYNNLNPTFNEFTLNNIVLNRSNDKLANRWEIWDYASSGTHQLVGSAIISMSEILSGKRSIDTSDQKGNFTGSILLDDIRRVLQFSIIEYISMGLNLSLTVGIDFTGSNGNQSEKNSLHFIGSNAPNQYQSAIAEVGMVIMDYDYDKMVPAFGFGAKFPGDMQARFCFPINQQPENPSVHSYQGILEAYRNVLPSLKFSGPTNFSPIIMEAVRVVRNNFEKNKMNYSILMILTDGAITDFPDTVNAIVQASSLPMSIIIIGVGDDDFSMMDKLDADKGGLQDSAGKKPARDIVQFVPYKEVAKNPSRLSEAVLRELPRQIDVFYQSIGVIPTNTN